MRILVLGSYGPSLRNFRGEFIRLLVARGHDVIAAAPEIDPDTRSFLRGLGVDVLDVRMNRSQIAPWQDLALLTDLWTLCRAKRPDIVVSYTIKPTIYGSIAARLAGVPRRTSIITGLGTAFVSRGLVATLRRFLVSLLYGAALATNEVVIFQNEDDREEFITRRIVSTGKTVIVPGSGVDLTHYKPSEPPNVPVTFLMIARLLIDKGVREYVEAASLLADRYPQARFRLVGPTENHPRAIPLAEIEKAAAEGVIEYVGPASDVRPELERCSVYVLPSYREGLPRSVLEALATGRAVVTSDAPGCRETVIDGSNGYLVPVRDARSLSRALEGFLEHPERIREMGAASLALARSRFDVRQINEQLVVALGL